MALRLSHLDDRDPDRDRAPACPGHADILAAIELVRRGFASRVTISNLADGEGLAGFALAAAAAAGVGFRFERPVDAAPVLRFSREDA